MNFAICKLCLSKLDIMKKLTRKKCNNYANNLLGMDYNAYEFVTTNTGATSQFKKLLHLNLKKILHLN